MLLIERNSVCCFVASIRSGAQFATDCNLSSKTNDPDAHFVTDQGIDCLMYISGVRGEEGTEDDQHFSGAVTRCMTTVAR